MQNDIIVATVVGKEPTNLGGDDTQFREATKITKDIEKSNEELLRENKTPDRSMAKKVSKTELSIDLALAATAKQYSQKILKFETFLAKIEDKIFNDETIAELTSGDLLTLYTNTRLMKSETFKTLQAIKKDIDFDKLEINILALNAKDENSSDDSTPSDVSDILDKVMENENFLELAMDAQLDDK